VPVLFWDASALVKRYLPERGTDAARALIDDPLAPRLATTPWGFAKTYAVLRRRHNEGRLDLPTFLTMTASLRIEVVDSGKFSFLSIEDAAIFASPLMMRRHGLNATDAAILTMLLGVLPNLPPGEALVLVAADTRLLRAGAAEGLATLNPEVVAAADLPALLAAL
jgi:predicted nucleic acid-binding protein